MSECVCLEAVCPCFRCCCSSLSPLLLTTCDYYLLYYVCRRRHSLASSPPQLRLPFLLLIIIVRTDAALALLTPLSLIPVDPRSSASPFLVISCLSPRLPPCSLELCMCLLRSSRLSVCAAAVMREMERERDSEAKGSERGSRGPRFSALACLVLRSPLFIIV